MSNPALPLAPEPAWPISALTEVATIAAISLDASGVWVALRDSSRKIVPIIAKSVVNGVSTALNAKTTPDIVKNAIATVINSTESFGEYQITDLMDAPTLPLGPGEGGLEIASLAAERILYEGEAVGALIVTRGSSEPFIKQHMLVLRACAHQAAGAIRQAALLERVNTQSSILRALLAASNALISSLDPRDVFHAIIESVQMVIQFERALIYRYDERSQTLTVIAVSGLDADTLSGEVIPLDDPVSKAAQVARDELGWVGTIPAQHVAGRHTDRLRAGVAVSMLCEPLLAKGVLHGVMSLVRERGFSPRDVDAMKVLSPYAAAALENAQLFQRVIAAGNRQKAILTSASDGIAVVNSAMKLILVNGAFGRLLGADPVTLESSIACHAFGAAQGPEKSANCLLCARHGRCQLREAFRTRQDRTQMEVEFPAQPWPNGQSVSYGPTPINQVVSFNVTYTPILNGHPQLTLLGRDITAQRAVEQMRAENVNTVTHEIGTPTQIIVNALEVVLNRYQNELEPEYVEALQNGLSTALSIRQLVNDLAMVAQRDAGSWIIEPERGDLLAQARQTVNELRVSATLKGVSLALIQPTYPLPQAMIDPGRAVQVARNLISNAIKYTPRGGQVQVAVSADAKYVRLRVEDNGIGISPEDQQHVWEWRYRAPQAGDGPRILGQGRGLAIVRSIMKAHGGVWNLESAPGKGSAFSVGYPRADVQRPR